MKRLLNTLFVTSDGAYLGRDGETVYIRTDNETKLRVPVHNLSGIVVFGHVSLSSSLIGLCSERNVLISFHGRHGGFLGRCQGPVSGNVLLRREQYRRADDLQAAAAIARNIVTAKAANCRTVLLRGVRDHAGATDAQALAETATSLSRILRALEQPLSLDEVRGREGEAAKAYFSVLDHLIVSQKDAFQIHERSRRPPLDAMNALLSFLYVLLAHDVTAALESVGLDPAVGFLHRDRPGRPGLALDLMEELRPVLADRLALTLVNRQQVRGPGFARTEAGAVVMDEKTRKQVLVSWQKRKTEEITHPFLGEKIPIGLLPYAQALLLARHLRGDLDGYPPFIWR